jgi:hypothetical protein
MADPHLGKFTMGERYPPIQLLRLLAALVIGIVGWFFWCVSMFAPAYFPALSLSGINPSGIGGMTSTEGFSVAVYQFVIASLACAFPFVLFRGLTGLLVSSVFCSLYCLAVLSAWLPIFFRSSAKSLVFWRLVSVGLLLPTGLCFIQWSDGGNSVGLGGYMWAVGSMLIFSAICIVPPKLPGEPMSALTVLGRIWRGNSVLRFNVPNPDRAFPVVEGDSLDTIE